MAKKMVVVDLIYVMERLSNFAKGRRKLRVNGLEMKVPYFMCKERFISGDYRGVSFDKAAKAAVDYLKNGEHKNELIGVFDFGLVREGYRLYLEETKSKKK